MATGRSVSKFISFFIDDSGAALRQVAINSLGGVGLTYETTDLTAFEDAITGAMSNHPSFEIEITGPFDNTASTGGHIVMSGVNGGVTPLTFDFQFGIQSAWSSGDPQFGVTGSATNGGLVHAYTVDPSSMMWTATLSMFPGSIAPAWGTAAET